MHISQILDITDEMQPLWIIAAQKMSRTLVSEELLWNFLLIPLKRGRWCILCVVPTMCMLYVICIQSTLLYFCQAQPQLQLSLTGLGLFLTPLPPAPTHQIRLVGKWQQKLHISLSLTGLGLVFTAIKPVPTNLLDQTGSEMVRILSQAKCSNQLDVISLM